MRDASRVSVFVGKTEPAIVFVPTRTYPRIRDFHSSVCLRCVSGLG